MNLINIIGDSKPRNAGGLKKLGAVKKSSSVSKAKKKQPTKMYSS